MKKFIACLGIVAGIATTAIAHKHDFGVSVYDRYDRLPHAGKLVAAQTQQRAKALFPGFYVVTDKLTGAPRIIYGKTLQVPGTTAADKSAYLMANQLQQLGVEAAQWQRTNVVNAPHASFAHYKQVIDGREVVFSQMSFRYTKTGDLQRLTLKTYGQPQPGTQPVLTAAQAENAASFTDGLQDINISSKTIATNLVWFPVPTQNGYVLRPSWPFTISGTDKHDEAMPVELEGYIDAIDGTVLYRTNNVKEEVNLTINGSVYKTNITTPATIEPLANLAVTIGSNTGYTDNNGYYVNNALNPAQTATLRLQGRWSTVRTGSASGTIPSFSHNIASNGTTYTYPNTAPSGDQFVNAYYHTNRMHDFMKLFYPTGSGFTGLDVSLPTIVDVTSTTGCNAFYNGTSINFFQENAACNSFANVNDVVYHEYGHGINGRFYGYIKGSGGMINGGLNEGYADIWALGLTKNPVLGGGAFKSGGSIRTYNTPAKVYPRDRNSEVHANGEIVAGAWWDYGTEVGSADSMSILFAKTLYDVPDGPEGTEGEVYHEVLISAIVNDDDDNDLTNGTPHFQQITKAFAAHGIFLMMDAALTHTEIANRKVESEPIEVKANISLAEPAYFKNMKLIYKNRTATNWDTIVLSNNGAGATGGVDFSGQIPAQPSGSVVDYFFLTYDMFDNPAYSFPNGYSTIGPRTEVTIPYQFAVGLRRVYGTDFEATPTDWAIASAASDNATSGKWTHAVPVASYWRPSGVSPYIQQPGNDNTSGTGKCLVTGNASSLSSSYSSADVDGGVTTAVSPIIDITGLNTPIIEYYRWYGNDQGGRSTNPRSDLWQVQVRDATSLLWLNVDFTYQSDYNWRRRIFNVRDYLKTSNTIQVRFVATDAIITSQPNNGENVVEAAVDDFFLYDAWATGIDNVTANNGIAVYPNPASNELTISLQNAANGIILLKDLAGRTLMQQVTDNVQKKYSLNTSRLAPGTYMIQVQNQQATYTQRTVIVH
ncbi:hypothetical protein CAP35_15175 [Chitinophagaceae bacterium IBVUCB1]|nr:hypothetical protein CAP35_15175 [Chitinophagaceae bacterium IBVUCB1]